jgi:beta-catenin-like protein 1
LSFIPPISETIIQQTDLLPWLMKRVSVKPYDANKQYASEILAILLGGGRDNILALDKGKTGGVEGLLNVLAVSKAVLYLGR